MAGAAIGETWKGRGTDASWQIAKAAFWGRLWGTLGKLLIAAAMIAVVVVAMLV
jgi:hypothetical protein